MAIHILDQVTYGGVASHPAPASAWNALAQTLQPLGAHRDIYLNELGENPSVALTSYKIASLIKAGAVWVDWCGWPMYGQGGASGFSTLLGALGVSIPGLTFDTSKLPQNISLSAAASTALTYERILISTAPFPAAILTNYRTGYGSTSGIGQKFYFASSFAIKYGKGAYIYAFGNNGQSFGLLQFNRNANPGVLPTNYIPFVIDTIQSLPALVTPQPTSPPSCGQYGTYVGAGAAAGVQPGLYVFTRIQNGEKVNTVVDNACRVVAVYAHNQTPAPSSGGSSGGSTSTGGSKPPATSGGSTAGTGGSAAGSSGGTTSSQPTTGLIIAAVGIAGAFFLMRKMDGRR